MNFESKYNFGDTVYTIEELGSYKWEECSVCLGIGEIELSDKKYTCPECRGRRGEQIHTGGRWKVNYQPKTIGRISVEIYAPKFNRNNRKDDYSYMCSETGVGSGTIWYQCDLYESKEEAQDKCDRLNEMIENKREQIKNEILNGRTMSQYGLWSTLEKEINNIMRDFHVLEEFNKLS